MAPRKSIEMMKISIVVAMFLFAVAMTGCNHIPMSTMLKMASFDGADFVALDPSEIKVKVLVEGTRYIESNGAVLKGVISYPDKDMPYNFNLEVHGHKEVEIEGGLFSKSQDGTEVVYILGLSNLEQFRSLQKFTKSNRRPKFKYDVSSTFSVDKNFNGNFKDIRLTISLMLKESEGYLKVLDGVNFK